MALGLAALLVMAGAVAGFGVEAKSDVKADVRPALTDATLSMLAPALVVAHRPSVTEILDLVLGDRAPTSALSADGKFALGSDEARIAATLGKYTADRSRANRIAAALVREGRRRNIGSSLLVGVLLTENPSLDPGARSSAGARGLMQVMPFHAGKWGCASGDLFDIESNICHGVAILADNLKASPTLSTALLGYNGCVRGTNTPDCWRYPSSVYKLARKGAQTTSRFPAGTAPFAAPLATRPRGLRVN